jgi:hypothetical protein
MTTLHVSTTKCYKCEICSSHGGEDDDDDDLLVSFDYDAV